MERAVLTGIGLLRAVSFVWMLVVLVVQRDELRPGWHAVLAWALVGLALVVTIWLAALRARRPQALLGPVPVSTELAVGLALMLLDGVVFAHGHVGSGQSALAASWPLAGVLTAGVAFGERVGLCAGIAMGVGRIGSAPLNGLSLGHAGSTLAVSWLSTVVLYGLAGGVSGYAVRLLRRADDEVARARAREEVSRTLHDGVLQTLALVERRASDPQLASLAREQEQELRAFLAGDRMDELTGSAVSAGQIEERLRRVSGRVQRAHDVRIDVVVAADLHPLALEKAKALEGAVAEALVNAGKHAGATRVTVFVEPSEPGGVFCSVKDNGGGFDGATVSEGLGITGSIRRRIEAAGGRVEIDGGLGHGAEVKMWM